MPKWTLGGNPPTFLRSIIFPSVFFISILRLRVPARSTLNTWIERVLTSFFPPCCRIIAAMTDTEPGVSVVSVVGTTLPPVSVEFAERVRRKNEDMLQIDNEAVSLGAGGVGWLFEDIQGLEDGDMISLDVL